MPKLSFDLACNSLSSLILFSAVFIGLLKNLLLVLLVITVMYSVSRNFVPENWIQLIIKGGIIGVICTTIFMGAYIRTPGAQNIISKVKGLLKREES